MQALATELTAAGRYAAVMMSCEQGRVFDDVAMAEPAILSAWRGAARRQLPEGLRPPPWPNTVAGAGIASALQSWAETCPRPLVVFLDEIDALRPAVLESVLGQLRGGFPGRPKAFPASLALVGMRDVRDYVLASGGSGRHGAGSPFNVSSASYFLRPFTRAEVEELYNQHTAEAGQAFTADAFDRAYDLTRGQPWLINALASTCVDRVTGPIGAAHIDAAKEILIRRDDTHLDSLAERLREPRVRRVLQPILAGGVLEGVPRDDLRYAAALGLVRSGDSEPLQIANPIYAEVIPRVLAEHARASMPAFQPTWLDASGSLDP